MKYSTDNKSLYKYCKAGIRLTTFLKNISCLSIYSSYHIWLCRNDLEFHTPPSLPAPFQPSPGGAQSPPAPSLETWRPAQPWWGLESPSPLSRDLAPSQALSLVLDGPYHG